MSILVVDVGTSSVRAAVVRDDASVTAEHQVETLPDSPAPGLVEFDAVALADAALGVARRALAEGGPVVGVGVTNQRASTVVWDRATGEPVAPALGWQDLRTVGTCLVLGADGIRTMPNASATKLGHLLDEADPDRSRDLCFGTVDTWIVWNLTGGALHVTDASNAGATALTETNRVAWGGAIHEALRIPPESLPRIVDSSGVVGEATALDGAPPIAGIAGDQQASLFGQSCVHRGDAKATFGTGAMLDQIVGAPPDVGLKGPGGTFPIVARQIDGEAVWGVEAIMLAAGTNIEWLRDDLGVIDTAAHSHDVAAACDSTGGVVYVPALLGLGTPHFDYGARGALLGLTRGTGRPEIVRAVLEGVAQRGADLVEAAEADSGLAVDALRVDGGMTDNPTFVAALAAAIQRPVEVSPVREATTLGAAFLAGLATGVWSSTDDIAGLWSPRQVVEPGPPFDRERWADAVRRASEWEPDLSALEF